MLELKSLITLSIFLFSHAPSLVSADPVANPEPQWWGGSWPQAQAQPKQQQPPSSSWLPSQWGANQNQPKQQQPPPFSWQPPQWGPNQNQPYQNNNPQPNPPYQQNPRPGSTPAYPQQTPQPGGNQNQNQNGPLAPPKPTPTNPKGTPSKDPPEDDGPSAPRWTPPPAWGPRTTPFGPKSPPPPPQPQPQALPPGSPPITAPAPNLPPKPKPTGYRPDYCTNTDLICTTTIDEAKEPVPYAVTCGKTRFNEYDVSNALTTGCYWFKKGQKITGTEFPRVFDNSNGRFDFGTIKGPFMEFPLIDSAAYISGPPGAHRVVFSTPDCFLAGELTTEGQRNSVYTECTEEF